MERETYYGIRIGKQPTNPPYLMYDPKRNADDGPVPRLFRLKSQAQDYIDTHEMDASAKAVPVTCHFAGR